MPKTKPVHKFPEVPVPKGLKKRGIQGYSSNLKEGETVQLPVAHLAMILGDDIREHFAKKKRNAAKSEPK